MIGIDVGSEKLKIVEGSSRNGHVSISAACEMTYNGEIVYNGSITDSSSFGFLVHEALSVNNIKSRDVSVVVSSSDIIVRDLKLPKVKESELKAIITNQMEKMLKSDQEFYIDYAVINPDIDGMFGVMAYAVPINLVKEYYSVLKELGLHPVHFDISENIHYKLLSHTTINQNSNENENMMFMDIGHNFISYYGFTHGQLFFCRTDPSPIEEFMQEMRYIERPEDEGGGDYLNEIDFSPIFRHRDERVNDTCSRLVYKLTESMTKYIQYLVMNTETKRVGRIVISGGIASINGLDKAFQESLGIKVETLNSTGKVTMGPQIPYVKFSTAAGALLRL